MNLEIDSYKLKNNKKFLYINCIALAYIVQNSDQSE